MANSKAEASALGMIEDNPSIRDGSIVLLTELGCAPFYRQLTIILKKENGKFSQKL
ncbi:MAG: hypothetical protein M1348_01970 [Candidatus Parvarchaeota archaeon]|nr:hypothetical protein [Candidatus Parvarchaeota archaeon]MCL5101356.1 hypothetical protein [Candidatus Parvarchaeota archaeon]